MSIGVCGRVNEHQVKELFAVRDGHGIEIDDSRDERFFDHDRSDLLPVRRLAVQHQTHRLQGQLYGRRGIRHRLDL